MISTQQMDFIRGISVTKDAVIQEKLIQCIRDTRYFAQWLLPEWFNRADTAQHKAIWDLIDDDTLPKVCICGYRGIGKSAIGKAKIIKSILFRQQPFILIVGRTHDYAAAEADTIKMELLTNPAIREIFGSVKAGSYGEVDLMFSKRAWYAQDPATDEPIAYVVPKGAEQPVRGINVRIGGRIRRPTYIYVDDFDDDEEVENEDLRKKWRLWFHGALSHCVETVRPDPRTDRWIRPDDNFWTPPWRIHVQDTFKHEDALVPNLMTDSSWVSVRLPQYEIGKDFKGKRHIKSLVPEVITSRQAMREVRSAEESGTLDALCREKMCLPFAPLHAGWSVEMYQYFNDRDPQLGLKYNPNIDRFIIVDPARTANARSAFTAMLVVAADVHTSKIFFRDLVNKRLDLDVAIDLLFQMVVDTNSYVVAVETTGNEALEHQIKNEGSRRGIYIQLLPMKAKTLPRGDYGTGRDATKRARAAQVIPYYRRHFILHEWSLKGSALEMQQLSYPRPRWWDALDCASYVPLVLEKIGRYFQPQVQPDEKEVSNPNSWEYDLLGVQLEMGHDQRMRSPFRRARDPFMTVGVF